MKKKRPIIIISLIILLLFLGGWYFVSHQNNGYQASDTIKTGQLRDTTFSLVSSAENSTLNYKKQYGYIEDIGDGRGYTAGIIGFTAKTGDLRDVVLHYQKLRLNNRLTKYLPALKNVQGSASHKGLGKAFVRDWKLAANDKKFIQAQNKVLNQQYMEPALKAAKKDDLGALGQYIYYDALVVHGPGNNADSFGGIRKQAMKIAKTPSQDGSQSTYLREFLKVRSKVMLKEKAHQDLSRLNVQLQFIHEKKFKLQRPLNWKMYGDEYHLDK